MKNGLENKINRCYLKQEHILNSPCITVNIMCRENNNLSQVIGILYNDGTRLSCIPFNNFRERPDGNFSEILEAKQYENTDSFVITKDQLRSIALPLFIRNKWKV